MNQLTLQLPAKLHQQLIQLAEDEGVSLSQYVIDVLIRQVAFAYQVQATSPAEIQQQQQSFQELLKDLGQASSAEVKAVLAQRDPVQTEADLSPEIVARLQQRIREASQAGGGGEL